MVRAGLAYPSEGPSNSLDVAEFRVIMAEPYLEESTQSLPTHPTRLMMPGERKLDLISNNFRFTLSPQSTVFIYSLSVKPRIEGLDRNIIRGILGTLRSALVQALGEFINCGTVLFAQRDMELLPECRYFPSHDESAQSRKRKGPRLKFSSSYQATVYKTVIKKIGALCPDQPESGLGNQSMQFLNVLVRSMLKELGFIQLGSFRNHYNESLQKTMDRQRLLVLPGYFTSVNCYRDGLQLRVDLVHKVIRQDTVLEYIEELLKQQDGRSRVEADLKDSVIMTVYGNRNLHKVKSVLFDESPMSTFEKGSKLMTYSDYFQERYHITILDKRQPLLEVSRSNKESIRLIPELCRMTGLSDSMTANRELMTGLSAITKKAPEERYREITHLAQQLNALQTNESWKIAINPNPINIQGIQLQAATIQVRGGTIPVNPNAKFLLQNQDILSSVRIDSWMVFFSQRDSDLAELLVTKVHQCGNSFGIVISTPRMIAVDNYGTKLEDMFTGAILRETNPQLQIVVTVLPQQHKQIYNVIKGKLTKDRPLPSQNVLVSTIRKNNLSVFSKIALQMAAKVGCELWHSVVPRSVPPNTMIIGIDICKSQSKSDENVVGLCATLNNTFTKYWNQVAFQRNNQEMSVVLTPVILNVLRQYYKQNNKSKPSYIVLYRDGVKPSQYHNVIQVEIAKVLNTLKTFDSTWNPRVSIVVVNKRVKARFFTRQQGSIFNLPPGVVVESAVVASHFNFYLTSHHGDGTLTPTHYNVVFDDSGWTSDILENLTNCLCFDYYNWTGAIRVPAPCMYARRMSTLVAKHSKTDFHPTLSLHYFYL